MPAHHISVSASSTYNSGNNHNSQGSVSGTCCWRRLRLTAAKNITRLTAVHAGPPQTLRSRVNRRHYITIAEAAEHLQIGRCAG